MSIQAQITRLENNVNNALSAIADKGVTVPSNANSDNLSTLIESISSGVDTSDATATAGDIMSGKTAYANGSKVTGSFSLDSEISTQDNLISQIMTALEDKAAGGSGGASVETCTVTIDASTCPTAVFYTPVLGQTVHWEAEMPMDVPDPFECVCGTVIIIGSSVGSSAFVTQGAEQVYAKYGTDHVFLITAQGGENVTISA